MKEEKKINAEEAYYIKRIIWGFSILLWSLTVGVIIKYIYPSDIIEIIVDVATIICTIFTAIINWRIKKKGE